MRHGGEQRVIRVLMLRWRAPERPAARDKGAQDRIGRGEVQNRC